MWYQECYKNEWLSSKRKEHDLEEETKQKLVVDTKYMIFYTDKENNRNIEGILQDGDVWLNVESLAELFQIDRTGIARHIQHIYQKGELAENSTCAFFAQVQTEGARSVTRSIAYYNLDMMLAIGFRVNSKPAIQFRTWANQKMKESVSKSLDLKDNALMEKGRFPVWTRWWECMKKKIKEWIKNRRKEI